MLLAHMLLQLINARIALPSPQSVASTAFGAASDAAVIVSYIAMLRRDVAVSVGFAAKRSIAAMPGASVAIWVDVVGEVGIKDVCRRRVLAHTGGDIHIMARANYGSIGMPVIGRAHEALPINRGVTSHGNGEARLHISERLVRHARRTH